MTSFTDRIRPHVEHEIAMACRAERSGDAATAFARLERAHVLGQASTWLHVRVHCRMLLAGLRQRRARQVLGQLIRIAGAATKTPFGLVPPGNTGGADVSPFRRLPIAADLQRLIDAARA